MFSFKRGVKLPEYKPGKNSRIIKMDIPEKLIISLSQHIGKPATPVVNQGDYVSKFQKIAQTDGNISANIHAPTSGIIKEINKAIILEPDKEDKAIKLNEHEAKKLEKEKIIQLIKEGGVVGMGGAQFPTHVKLDTSENIDEFILNGCECEPYLTTDHRLMLEHADEIVQGMKLMMKATGAKKGIIAIEKNKSDAFRKIHKLACKEGIKTEILKTKYPQGAEKMLIYALTKKKVPPGKLPSYVNCVVNNVATAKAAYDAVIKGKPLVQRVVTVTGDTKKTKNIMARIGTPLQDLIDIIGRPKSIKKVIQGGPMMGSSVDSTENSTISKGSSGIVLQKKPLSKNYDNCIRCGKCLEVCPMNLVPAKIVQLSKNDMFEEAKKINAMDCIECGCCAYSCPSSIPLVQYIRLAKKGIKNESGKE
ncbi:MAG: electron transport complex subunit RsxC [Nanobdellota archaeon]